MWASPPAGSRLAESLKRGQFARTFGKCEVLGSGGFGSVVKAWHEEEERWYAVKQIPVQVRAHETAEENHDAWSGPEVFEKLCRLRSPHVLRYYKVWTELPEDLPISPNSGCKPELRDPGRDTPSILGSDLPSMTTLTELRAGKSEGGFLWAEPSWADEQSTEDSAGDDTPAVWPRSPPASATYSVVLLVQMECCEGMTLSSWLARPQPRLGLLQWDLQGVLELSCQLLAGLADLHEADIVHCDVKPGNIMVSEHDGQLKLFDFGLSRLRSKDPQQHGSRVPPSLAQDKTTHTAVGTPGYAPPELCVTRERPRIDHIAACPSVDIFSAGVVLVELLMAANAHGPAWRTAMERAGALAQLREGRGSALPAALLRSKDIDMSLRQLILRMLHWDAGVRPTSLEVVDEVEAWLWAASRRNPYLGTGHPRAPQFAAMPSPLCTAHNPYVGFFLDHRVKLPSRLRCVTNRTDPHWWGEGHSV